MKSGHLWFPGNWNIFFKANLGTITCQFILILILMQISLAITYLSLWWRRLSEPYVKCFLFYFTGLFKSMLMIFTSIYYLKNSDKYTCVWPYPSHPHLFSPTFLSHWVHLVLSVFHGCYVNHRGMVNPLVAIIKEKCLFLHQHPPMPTAPGLGRSFGLSPSLHARPFNCLDLLVLLCWKSSLLWVCCFVTSTLVPIHNSLFFSSFSPFLRCQLLEITPLSTARALLSPLFINSNVKI